MKFRFIPLLLIMVKANLSLTQVTMVGTLDEMDSVTPNPLIGTLSNSSEIEEAEILIQDFNQSLTEVYKMFRVLGGELTRLQNEVKTNKKQVDVNEDDISAIKQKMNQETLVLKRNYTRRGLGKCGFGIQDFNVIKNGQMTASSIYNANYQPYYGRVHYTGTGWWPQTNNVDQWLQVDLGEDRTIIGIVTQGINNDKPRQTRTYMVLHRLTPEVAFQHIKDDKGSPVVFEGNVGESPNLPVANMFRKPIVLRWIRINPRTWATHIGLRMELLVC